MSHMIGYKYDEISGTLHPDARPAALRRTDFEGDASRFGARIIKDRKRIRACGSTEYVGTAQNPCPVEKHEHVLPHRANLDKPRGSFGVIVDAVRAGELTIGDLDPKTARRIARILYG